MSYALHSRPYLILVWIPHLQSRPTCYILLGEGFNFMVHLLWILVSYPWLNLFIQSDRFLQLVLAHFIKVSIKGKGGPIVTGFFFEFNNKFWIPNLSVSTKKISHLTRSFVIRSCLEMFFNLGTKKSLICLTPFSSNCFIYSIWILLLYQTDSIIRSLIDCGVCLS